MPFKKGEINNPEGKGGFAENPENRSDGRWKSEDSIPYNYNKLLRMTVKEVKDWLVEHPDEERTMAQELAYQSVVSARSDLGYLKEVTDRTSGKAPQTIKYDGEISIGAKEVAQLLQELLDDDSETENSDTDNS